MQLRTIWGPSLLFLSFLSACSGCDGCSGSQEIAPPVAMKPPEPAPTPPPVETNTVAEDADAMRDTLLGLNQPVEPAPVEVAPTPVRRRRPKIEAPAEEEDPGPKGLSEHAFYSALDSWGGVKKCVAKTPAIRKDGTSAISVRFIVNQDGSVAESKIVEKSNKHAEAIAPCVELEAKRVRFPGFEEPQPVQKDAKFVF